MESRNPNSRFGAFNIKWSVSEASKLFCVETDKGHPDLPVLSASQEHGMVKRDNIGINMQYSKQNVASYKRVLPGCFVIHLRSFQGGFAHSSIEGITSPAYTVLKLRNPEKHDDYFWKYLFRYINIFTWSFMKKECVDSSEKLCIIWLNMFNFGDMRD